VKPGSTPTRRTIDDVADSWLEVVRQQISSLQFGVVQITVHESKVFQIERAEKARIVQKSLQS
jgi:hypothetical protein